MLVEFLSGNRKPHQGNGFQKLFVFMQRTQQPTPVFFPRESHGQRSLTGYSSQVCKETDIAEATQHTCIHGVGGNCDKASLKERERREGERKERGREREKPSVERRKSFRRKEEKQGKVSQRGKIGFVPGGWFLSYLSSKICD